MNTLEPYFKIRHSMVIDTSKNKSRHAQVWITKLRSYLEIPAFSIANTWRGASEIVYRFIFNYENLSLIDRFPITAPSGANFVPVVSWLVDQVFYRYKLWSDVGEILWLPIYSGQRINTDFFFIEIWNTNTTQQVGLGTEDGLGLGLEGLGGLLGLEDTGILDDILLETALRLYSSKLIAPTKPFCDDTAVALSIYGTCGDPIYDLTDFEPLYGDYYLLVFPCERRLIKGRKAKPAYNLLKNRDDNTWHEIWMYVDPMGQVSIDINPDNAIPPVDALGYFPMIPAGNLGNIFKFELTLGPDGTGNYPVFDALVTGVEAFNVVLLQDENNPDDAHLYGMYLYYNGFGSYTYNVIQTIITP